MPGGTKIENPPVLVEFPGTIAFDTNSPNPSAWTDLDLSAIIGTRVCICILRLTYGVIAGSPIAKFRPNGDTVDRSNAYKIEVYQGAQNLTGHIIVLSDAAGIVEWYVNSISVPTTITVEAFIHG